VFVASHSTEVMRAAEFSARGRVAVSKQRLELHALRIAGAAIPLQDSRAGGGPGDGTSDRRTRNRDHFPVTWPRTIRSHSAWINAASSKRASLVIRTSRAQ